MRKRRILRNNKWLGSNVSSSVQLRTVRADTAVGRIKLVCGWIRASLI